MPDTNMPSQPAAGNALIPITAGTIGGEPIQTVNARDLHAFLEVKSEFRHWIKNRIDDFGFTQDVDFVAGNFLPGSERIDYFVSLDMAKELSMVERTRKGKQARQYFIECERAVKSGDALADRTPSVRKTTHTRNSMSGALLKQVLDFPDKLRRQFPGLSDNAVMVAYHHLSEAAIGLPVVPLPVLTEHYYTTTEIAKEAGVSPQKAGQIANQLDLKIANYGETRLSKSQHSDKQVEQWHWNATGRGVFLSALTRRDAGNA